MANVLRKEKQEQIVALGRLGWTVRRIAIEIEIRRETASKYLKAAGINPRRGRPANSKRAIWVSTDLGTSMDTRALDSGHRVGSRSACAPYREKIEGAVHLGRNAKAIWQDLVDDHGFQAGYASVKRFVGQLRAEAPKEAHPVIVTTKGEEAQVDYGTGPMVRDPETGKYRRTRLFTLTLGYSRKSIHLLAFRSSSRIWAEHHETAFRRLGGACRVIVLDNLREGVIQPETYDPTLNPLYQDVLKHYGAVAFPCRVRDPNRKGKVESSVGYAQKTLVGLRFESLKEAQAYIDRWEEHWADTRIHGTTKRQVSAMFAEERPHLLPLPAEPFRYFHFGERSVHLDGCVEVEAAYYSVPPGFIGQKVSVQWDELFVRILDKKTGALLREHVHQQRRGHYRVADDDVPTRTPASTKKLLLRAQHAGCHIEIVVKTIHQREGEFGIRRMLGIFSLVKKYGAKAVNDACGVALETGTPSYRFLRRYLERHPLPLTLRQVDPLIRELTHYRELISQRIGASS